MLNDPIVVVVEKPSAGERFAPHLSAHWPGRTIFVIATLTFGLYEFRYPRGLRMAAFPYLGDPVWRPREFNSEPVWEIKDGVAAHLDMSPEIALHGASTIVYACDPDARGAMAFHVLLQQTLGESSAVACRPALSLTCYNAKAIDAALETLSTTCDPWFESARNAGLARRYFDYNFNVNAMALLSPRHGQRVSKYSLQLLYALRDQQQSDASRRSANEENLIAMMQHWVGTGKYPPSWLGSPTSQIEIIRVLQSQGWLAGASLTVDGHAFLDSLHPDCCDLDLPSRISQWEQSWPASRPSMERYLRTFFGKQKRFRSQQAN